MRDGKGSSGVTFPDFSIKGGTLTFQKTRPVSMLDYERRRRVLKGRVNSKTPRVDPESETGQKEDVPPVRTETIPEGT